MVWLHPRSNVSVKAVQVRILVFELQSGVIVVAIGPEDHVWFPVRAPQHLTQPSVIAQD